MKASTPSPSFLGARATRFAGLAVALAAAAYQYAYYCPGLDSIRGSVVVITGSSSGIGEELAYQYGALGARIVLAARRASELERVAEGARAKGAQDVLVVPTDMSNGPACEALVAAAVAKFGRLDTVILNHASVDDQLFLSHEGSKSIDDQILFLMKVNVLGSAYVARAAIPHLEKTGGHIAVTSSGTAKIAAPFHAGYVASKRALHGLFDTIRHELKLLGSKVTIGIQVLGMIATAEVMRDEALRPLAMPVPKCAAEMICAVQARWREVYIPKWMAPWTAITYLHPWISEASMEAYYIDNVPRYSKAVQDFREEKMGA